MIEIVKQNQTEIVELKIITSEKNLTVQDEQAEEKNEWKYTKNNNSSDFENKTYNNQIFKRPYIP